MLSTHSNTDVPSLKLGKLGRSHHSGWSDMCKGLEGTEARERSLTNESSLPRITECDWTVEGPMDLNIQLRIL